MRVFVLEFNSLGHSFFRHVTIPVLEYQKLGIHDKDAGSGSEVKHGVGPIKGFPNTCTVYINRQTELKKEQNYDALDPATVSEES
jgi:hypothetical protein